MGNIANSIEHLISIYRDVANAIRSKAGTSNTITPDDFAQQILNLPTGGGDSAEWVPYTLTLLAQSTISLDYPVFSFEDNEWYFYDSEQETFIQRDPSSTLIDSTILGNNFYIKIIEQTTFDKILLALADSKILLTASINNDPLDIISDELTIMELHTTSKLSSLSSLELSLSYINITAGREDNDILISNNDNANAYPTLALSSIAGNTTKSLWIDKDTDTNYLLDKFFGKSDPNEENRTFAPIEDITYDSATNTLSWTSCYQVQNYEVKLYINNEVVSSTNTINPTYTKYSDQNEHTEITLSCSYDTLHLENYDALPASSIDLEAQGPRCFDLGLLEKLSVPINSNPAPDITVRYIPGESVWFSNMELTFNANEVMNLKLKSDDGILYQDLPNVYGQNTITIPAQTIIENDYHYFYLCRPTVNKLASISNLVYAQYFEVELDPIKQFKLATSGDDAGYYVSTNHDNNGYSYCKLNMRLMGVSRLKISYLQYSESGCDYALFSKLNTTLSQDNIVDSSSMLSKNCYSERITDYNNPGVFYIDVDQTLWVNEVFLTVKYRHDHSVITMPDRIAFKIEPIFWYDEE